MSIPRMSEKKRKSLNGKRVYSTITAKPKAPRKRNPKRIAKRKAGYRKMLSGKEYKVARAEAMRRAENQCEARTRLVHPLKPSKLFGIARCGVMELLHAHHLRYPKTRPLAASDLLILCKEHHEYAESQKMGKTRMF